ncbi:MAG: DUF1929 domain-containing protein, partial [Myxococcales bacterium]|nr:DUF1929 domain-containing protein [Myxococcales bacterium]
MKLVSEKVVGRAREVPNYGPLRRLIGRWDGGGGADTSPDTPARTSAVAKKFWEKLIVEEHGHLSNHDQTLYALRYHRRAWRFDGNVNAAHEEVGYWAWQPDGDSGFGWVHHFVTTPRGIAVVTRSARIAANATVITVSTDRSVTDGAAIPASWPALTQPDPEISEVDHLEDKFPASRYSFRLDLSKNATLGYVEAVFMEVVDGGRTQLVHKMENTLSRDDLPGTFDAQTLSLATPAQYRAAIAATAETAGQFGGVVDWPLVPLHMSLLPDGRFVSFGSPLLSRGYPAASTQLGHDLDVWDPEQGMGPDSHHSMRDKLFVDAFCNAVKLGPEGLLFAGGTSRRPQGPGWGKTTAIFDHRTNAVVDTGKPLHFERWYSSLIRLPDDSIVSLGGSQDYCHNAWWDNRVALGRISEVPEVYTPGLGWRRLTTGYDAAPASGAGANVRIFGRADNRWWYPRAYLASDGRVFGVTWNNLWTLDLAGTGTALWHSILPNGHNAGASTASVMFRPDELLIVGGGTRSNEEPAAATNKVTRVRIAPGAAPTATAVTRAHPDGTPGKELEARAWATATVLPTGTVLITGGTTDSNKSDKAVLTALLWDPDAAAGTNPWTVGATALRSRLYHSFAVLVPDGTVLVGGGGLPPFALSAAEGVDGRSWDTPWFNVERYYPPYLFDGQQRSQRPTIALARGQAAYGLPIELTLGGAAGTISSVCLISLPTGTHSHNMDQRYIPLIDAAEGLGTFSRAGATLTVRLPAKSARIPPGHYMLFVVNDQGVPSEALRLPSASGRAEFLHLGAAVHVGPYESPGLAVGASSASVRVRAVSETSPSADKIHTAFEIVEGLNGQAGTISLRSRHQPNKYLRHQGRVIKLHPLDNSTVYKNDASWLPEL